MANVLITTEFFPEEVDRLRAAGHEVNVHEGPTLSPEELRERVRDVEGLICLLADRIDEEILARAARLRVVANLGVGVDNIDLSAATKRGIMVANTPDALTETTADLGWALLMAAARRVGEADRDLRAHGFPGWTFLPQHAGLDVHGGTLGIVGMGRIGAAVARRARGFSMRILYNSRTEKRDVEAELGARRAPLDELLSESDFVVLCVPLTSETRHLIGKRELELLGPEGVLVNISRGPVVDEDALVRALREGRLRAAALDVFEEEPRVHPGLLDLPHVVLTPHIGSATLATRHRMAAVSVDAVLAALSGGRPKYLVAPGEAES